MVGGLGFHVGNPGALHQEDRDKMMLAEYLDTDEGKEELKKGRQANAQLKAALFATRKAGKSLGYNSSSVFGGGSPDKNETGVILG